MSEATQLAALYTTTTTDSSQTEHGPFPKPTKLTRRMRPPDLEIAASMEPHNRVRVHSGSDAHSKVAAAGNRRESRLGFGRFFGRHRVVTETTAMRRNARNGTPEPRGALLLDDHPAGIKSETIGGLPYDLQAPASQSEVHLVASLKDIDAAMQANRPKTGVRSPTFTPPLGSPTTMATKRRGSCAATVWDPVPLFQAWPQAVRTATLPSCLQADSLLRLHNKKEMLPSINHPDLKGDEKDMFVAMAKKKHRRNSSSFKLDWTSKIYILVTSGYLLQYAGDGPHDVLPEKVVQLTKDSAAFASDAIPGKHWVLQVSSVFEDGALVSQDTRSLLGKFGLREKEKRTASDILMIFESAADMDSWMTLLRKEIEVLGGRAPLTEIGTPRLKQQVDDGANVAAVPRMSMESSNASTQVMTSPAGRTVPVRDPNFGSRAGSLQSTSTWETAHAAAAPSQQHASTFSTNNPTEMLPRWDAAITIESPTLHLDTLTSGEMLPEHSFDDNSASNSFVSQDGRQLDGLRDSANRYSFLSAARTMITSDSSACNSPIRDSFGSAGSAQSCGSHPGSEDVTPLAGDAEFDSRGCHLRPNGSEIENRRQSYRTSNAIFDPCSNTSGSGGPTTATHRAHSSLSVIQEPPNFSLPNRRRAASHTITEPPATGGNGMRPPRRPRRPPPPTLGFTRPLSIVADTPSPLSVVSSPLASAAHSASPGYSNHTTTGAPDSPSFFTTNWAGVPAAAEYDLSGGSRASSRQSNLTSFRVSTHTNNSSPRKYASMNSLRPADRSKSLWDDGPGQYSPQFNSSPREDDVSPTHASNQNDNIPRSMSAMSNTTHSHSHPQQSPHAQQQYSPLTGPWAPPRSRSPIQRTMAKAAALKRASMYNLTTPPSSSTTPGNRGSVSVFANNTGHRPTHSDGCKVPVSLFNQQQQRSPRQSLLSVQGNRESLTRRSMPHISADANAQSSSPTGSVFVPAGAGGVGVGLPPPAPPPNKALPPIPVAKKRRSGLVGAGSGSGMGMIPGRAPRMVRPVRSMACLPGGEF